MKKAIMAIAVLLCLTGCSSKITYTQIDYDAFQTKLDNKEKFILVIGSSTCSNCVTFKGTVESTETSKPVQMYYIYIDSLSDEDYAKLYSKYAVNSTPTTIFFDSGVETSTYDRIVGRVSSTELKTYLEKHGYLGN